MSPGSVAVFKSVRNIHSFLKCLVVCLILQFDQNLQHKGRFSDQVWSHVDMIHL